MPQIYEGDLNNAQDCRFGMVVSRFNDFITQGSGEEWMHMEPEELRVAVNAYLDKCPDFIKFGGTSHFSNPIMIGFSPRAQRVIVEETHRRGLVAETHSTSSEGLWMSVEAGIDLIQHPEVLPAVISDKLAAEIAERGIVCAMLSNTITGEPWQRHVDRQAIQELAAWNSPLHYVLLGRGRTPDARTSTNPEEQDEALRREQCRQHLCGRLPPGRIMNGEIALSVHLLGRTWKGREQRKDGILGGTAHDGAMQGVSILLVLCLGSVHESRQQRRHNLHGSLVCAGKVQREVVVLVFLLGAFRKGL